MKVEDLNIRSLIEPLVATCQAYGVDASETAVCIVESDVDHRRVLVATDLGLIDVVSAPIAGHPSGAWVHDGTVAAWRDLTDLSVTTHTVRDSWSHERHVTELTLTLPSLDLTIKADNADGPGHDERGVFTFAAECLRQLALQPISRLGS